VTDANVNPVIVGEDRFYPFGETRFTTGTMFTDKLFTGQRQIAELGIYLYGARFYSPKLGRFLSADTIVPGYANPQNLNRFSYVTNNPLRYTDPTGHRACEDGDGQGSCLSEKQVTKKYKADLAARKKKLRNKDDSGGGPVTDLTTPTITEPTLAEGSANDYSCFNNPSSCGGGNQTQSSSSPVGLELLLGIFALSEGLALTSVGIAAAVLVIGSAPLWATVIPAAIFVGVALVGVNWAVVGIQEINAGLHPDEHHEVDYLPLIPDAWQR